MKIDKIEAYQERKEYEQERLDQFIKENKERLIKGFLEDNKEDFKIYCYEEYKETH